MSFTSQDDKHFVKVYEPNYPVVAVERRKQAVVHADAVFAVGDYDFTMAKIIPSAVLFCHISEKNYKLPLLWEGTGYLMSGILPHSSPPDAIVW